VCINSDAAKLLQQPLKDRDPSALARIIDGEKLITARRSSFENATQTCDMLLQQLLLATLALTPATGANMQQQQQQQQRQYLKQLLLLMVKSYQICMHYLTYLHREHQQ
jgi:hypothetical protein